MNKVNEDIQDISGFSMRIKKDIKEEDNHVYMSDDDWTQGTGRNGISTK